MSVPNVPLPQFLLAPLGGQAAPRVVTDSAAERAWVPAYIARLTAPVTAEPQAAAA